MSWAEIKKAINSNISKSLDVLITEKSNEILTKLNSVYNTVTVKGNIPSVKSVQRGKVNYVPNVPTADDGFSIVNIINSSFHTFYYDFTINSVNMDKSIVFIDGSTNNNYYNNYSFTLLNSNTIRVYFFIFSSGTTSTYMYGFTWQVIEFY